MISLQVFNHQGDHRSRDRMIVGFTTAYAISAYHHYRKFESLSGKVYSIQHYVILFVVTCGRSMVFTGYSSNKPTATI
jgi:hypothetical protein